MNAQTRPPDEWIVVDDGETPTVATMGQRVIRRERQTGDPDITLVPNLKAAIESGVSTEAVAFIEDDDYYSPGWIEWLSGALKSADIAGEANAFYYHVGRRAWMNNKNRQHASLCQTGMRASTLPILYGRCKSSPFVDVGLWKEGMKDHSAFLRFAPNPLVIGMKGMPGRKGIGIGHIKDAVCYASDPGLSWLVSMIGEDALAYKDFYDRH